MIKVYVYSDTSVREADSDTALSIIRIALEKNGFTTRRMGIGYETLSDNNRKIDISLVVAGSVNDH